MSERREFEPKELRHFVNICSASGLIHGATISPDKQAGTHIIEKYREPVYQQHAKHLQTEHSDQEWNAMRRGKNYVRQEVTQQEEAR